MKEPSQACKIACKKPVKALSNYSGFISHHGDARHIRIVPLRHVTKVSGPHDTKHNDIQYNDTQQHNDISNNGTPHNHLITTTLSITAGIPSVIILSVANKPNMLSVFLLSVVILK